MREGKAGRLKSFRKAKQPTTRSQKARAQTTAVLIVLRVCPSVALGNASEFGLLQLFLSVRLLFLVWNTNWNDGKRKTNVSPRAFVVNIDVCIKWIIVTWSTVTTFCSPWAQVGIWHCDARIMLLGSRRSLFKFTNTAECVLLKWVLTCVSENTHIYTSYCTETYSLVHLHVHIMFV